MAAAFLSGDVLGVGGCGVDAGDISITDSLMDVSLGVIVVSSELLSPWEDAIRAAAWDAAAAAAAASCC